MLRPIDSSNSEVAIDLLARGFPKRSRTYWGSALWNMEQFGGNAAAGVPLGHILESGGRPVGVVLTPASIRRKRNGAIERTVNISSWYIEPDHRWQAPLMMRRLLGGTDAVFTDLTPSPAVQQMLPAFGFRKLSHDVAVNLLPLLAVTGSSKVRVEDLDAAPIGAIDAEAREFLAAHQKFGCVAAAFAEESNWQPLLFKPRKLRGIPAALLIYCECNSALYRNLGSVARYLLRRGKLALILDIPLNTSIPGIPRRGQTQRFAKGGDFDGRTDLTGSEMSLFDL